MQSPENVRVFIRLLRREYSFAACILITLNFAFMPTSFADDQIPLPLLQPTVLDYPTSTGADLGQGFNLGENSPTASFCVIGRVKNQPAQDQYLSIQSSQDASNSFNQTDVSASAQAQYLMGSASAKVQYIASHKYSQASSSLTVYEKVSSYQYYVPVGSPDTEDPTQSSLELNLTPQALNLAKTDISEFHHVCGDGYVATLVQGAELIGTISVDATSANELSQTNFSGSASYGIAGGSASLQSVLTDASSHSGFKLDYFQSGGSGQASPIDVPTMMTAVQALPSAAAANPKPFQVIVASYTNLPDWPGNAAFFQTITPLDEIMTLYWRYDALVQYISDIQSNLSSYNSMHTPASRLQFLYDTASAQEADLFKQAKACYLQSECGPPVHTSIDLYTIAIDLPLPMPPITPETKVFIQAQNDFFAYVSQWNKTKWDLIKAAAGQFDTNGGTCYNLNHYVTQALEQAGYPNNLMQEIQNFRAAVANQPANELNDAVDYYVRQPSQANCHPKYQQNGGADPDCMITGTVISQLRQTMPEVLARLITNVDPKPSNPPGSLIDYYNPAAYSGFDPTQISDLERYNLPGGCPGQTMVLSASWTYFLIPPALPPLTGPSGFAPANLPLPPPHT